MKKLFFLILSGVLFLSLSSFKGTQHLQQAGQPEKRAVHVPRGNATRRGKTPRSGRFGSFIVILKCYQQKGFSDL